MFVFVITTTAIVAELALLELAMLTTMVSTVPLIFQPVAPMLVREKAFLYMHTIPLAHSVACVLLLPKTFRFDGASSFHCFHESCESIENTQQQSEASHHFTCTRIVCILHDQICGRLDKTIPPVVPCWASRCCPQVAARDAHHLFPLMKMVDGICLDLLSDVAIATRHHMDVLPVPWLLLGQNFSDEKLHNMMEVCLT